MSETFKCQRCGQCCGLVPFTRKEYKKVLRKAKNLGISFVKDKTRGVYYTKKNATVMMKIVQKHEEKELDDLFTLQAFMPKLSCPFLTFDEEKKAVCRIYEDRPQVCRDFGSSSKPYLICPNNPRKLDMEIAGTLKPTDSLEEFIKKIT